MKPFIVILMLIGFVFSQTSSSEDDLDVGYYWRQYDKDIPDDAFPGGRDKRGKKTYIGQAVHGDGCDNDVVVTGHIFEAEQHIKYEWGYRQQVKKDVVQILCTRHPEHMEWIETNITHVHNLTDRHLVSGGREKNYTYYIGRMKLGDEELIGKVLVSDLKYMEGFYAATNGTKLHVRNDTYDVLAYNPINKQLGSSTVSNNVINNSLLFGTISIFILTIYTSMLPTWFM